MRRAGSLVVAAGAILLGATVFAGAVRAELPSITLLTIMPPGGKAGGDVEVALTGADLDEADALHFSHPGIAAKPKEKKFTVTIPADVPAGIYDVRVSGKFGVSNPRAFVVGDLPELVEAKPNDKPDAAVELPVGGVFNGVTAAATDEHFKFTAKSGQRVFVECAAAEIDSRLAPVFSVVDVAGRELEASRNGALLEFTAPADGEFFLRLHDITYAGGPEHFYRLMLTSGARLDFIFPPAAQPGTKAKFTIYGRNLPGGAPANLTGADGKPLEKLEVEIDAPATPAVSCDGLSTPASASVDGFSWRLKTPQGVSNPVFIPFSGASPLAEQEPNNKLPEAQKLPGPAEIAGQLCPAADRDCFTLEAKKGEVFSVEVLSQRLGLPTNPFVLIQRDGKDVQEIYGTDTDVGGKKFSTLTNDPTARFEVKEDGAYALQVRDLFGGTRASPRNVYRLSVSKEAPDFRLAVIAEMPPATPEDRLAAPRAPYIRGGETRSVRVIAFRRGNFTGDIELSAEGLPAGVTCPTAKIPAAKNEGLLLLTATEQAARWIGPVRVLGKAKAGETELVQTARGGVATWSVPDYNNEPVTGRLTRDFVVAVNGADPMPISVEPAEDKVWEVAVGAKLEIPLKVTRRGDFNEALKLKAFGAPEIEKAAEVDVAAKGATATATLDLATAKIPAGAHTIHFRAQSKGKVRDKETTFTIHSAAIRIAVK